MDVDTGGYYNPKTTMNEKFFSIAFHAVAAAITTGKKKKKSKQTFMPGSLPEEKM